MAERTPFNAADYSGADYIRFVCGTCQDFRVVAAPEGTDGSIPCPDCGTDEKRRLVFTTSKSMPQIRLSDLNDEESDLFRQWRFRGHHELDCLRWIEGRRYDPEKDSEFMADVEKHLAEWRKGRDQAAAEYAKGQVGPPLHPCVKCGTACDEQTLFCPPCWKRYQEERAAKKARVNP